MKEIIKKLQQDGTRFTIKGITTYKKEPKPFKINVLEYENDHTITSVNEDTFMGKGMNVDRFGPTCMWLYSYDIFENKTTCKINYKDVTIIEE